MREQLKTMIGHGETIYYEGNPDTKTFILESVFNPMLPVALIWGTLDLFMLFASSKADTASFYVNGQSVEHSTGMTFMLLFMAIHMLPVWIYLAGVLTTFSRLHHSYYIVTNRAVYISSGTFQLHYDVKPFAEMSRVVLHRGVFDRMFGVGDVMISTDQRDSKGRPIPMVIANISNYMEIYQMVSKLQQDIFTDTMYPNDLRPETNSGYKTKYTGM